MINLTVNGKPRSIETTEATIDLESYLVSFDLNLQYIAVGYNGEVIKKDQYPTVQLRDGDILEIVRPVGGG